MKKYICLLTFALLFVLTTNGQDVPPDHDACENAILIDVGDHISGSTFGATLDIAPSCLYDEDASEKVGVWYKFNAKKRGKYSLTISGPPSETKIGVFSESCDRQVCVSSRSQDSDSEEVTFYSDLEDQMYYILIRITEGVESSQADFTLTTQVEPAPDNDLCAGAIPIQAGSIIEGSTHIASHDEVSGCLSYYVDKQKVGIWYRLEGTGERFKLSTLGLYETSIGVFSGSCNQLTCVAGVNYPVGVSTAVTFSSESNKTYYILISGDQDHVYPYFTLTAAVVDSSVPINDLCADAIHISAGDFKNGTTTGATGDDNIASNCGTNEVGSESVGVWYQFLGTGDEITLSTRNVGITDFKTSIGVYTGSCTGLICETGRYFTYFINNLSFISEFGKTYYILVDGYEDRNGAFTLKIESNTAPAIPENDNCTSAIVIGEDDSKVGSTLGAKGDSHIASNCGTNIVESSISVGVWYQLVGTGKQITVSTCNSSTDYDTSISVYTGSCNELSCIAGNEFGVGCTPNSRSALSFISVMEETYYILIDGNMNKRGSFTLTTSSADAPNVPTNDNCSEAEQMNVLTDETSTYTEGNFTNATNFTGRVVCNFDNDDITDLWYRFNSGPNVEVRMVTKNFSGGYELYKNCGEAALNNCKIISYWDATIHVNPNTDYLLQIWSDLKNPFTFLLYNGQNSAAVVSDDEVYISRYSVNGYVVAVVAASDVQEHGQIFSITGGNEESIFSIDPTTGNITVVDDEKLKTSTTTLFDLTVHVADQGPGELYATGTVKVSPIDNHFPIIHDRTVDLDENIANNIDVLNVNATDPDNGAVLSYRIIGGNIESAFNIDYTGKITVADHTILDFETTPVFELEVEVTDDDRLLQLVSTATITIHLKDVNEAPIVSSATHNISKYSSTEDLVGTVEITDQDLEQTHTFAIEENTDAIFRIDGFGQIFIDDADNLLATQTPYTLTVTVTDNGNPPLNSSAIITINVVDNHTPVITSSNAFSVEENSMVGTAIGKITATEIENNQITFSIVGGNEQGGFSISPAEEIQVADMVVLDYETYHEFNLEIEALDDGPGLLAGFQTVHITVTDVNESPSVRSTTFNISYAIANGHTIGTIEAEDPEGQNLTYRITAGNTGNIFDLDFESGAISIPDVSLLNLSTTPSYYLTVLASDGSLDGSGTVSIHVFGNEYPSLSARSFNVDENSSSETLIATLSSNDLEGIINFEILAGNENNRLSLDNRTGELTVNNASEFDCESLQRFDIDVRIASGGVGNLQSTETVTIAVNDVNESPNVRSTTFNISHAIANGQTIGTIEAKDPEGQNLTYRISAGNTGDIFDLDFESGAISIPDVSLLNLLATPSYYLTVLASDGSLDGSGTVSIHVFGNEYPSLSARSFNVDENSSSETLIATLSSNDLEGIINFEILAGNENNRLSLDNRTGELTVNNASEFDYESLQRFDIDVRITSRGAGNLQSTETVTITINDLNEFAPEVNSLVYGLNENVSEGTVASTITATDGDSFQTLSYSITAGNTDEAFVIDESNGTITVKTPSELNFETDPTFSLTVAVSDDGDPIMTTSKSVEIGLTDVNEAPVVVSSVNNSLAENAIEGAEAATITATDEDKPAQTLSYAIADGNTDDAFVIDESNGTITVKTPSALNFETDPTFSLTVAVSDDGDPIMTRNEIVEIVLTDVNEAPVLVSIGNQSGDELAELTFTTHATDEDGDVLIFNLDEASSTKGMLINGQSGIFTWTPDESQGGSENTVTVTVKDGSLEDSETFGITVNEVLGLIGKNELNYKLFPNPVVDSFTLTDNNWNIQQVIIYDLNGTLVKSYLAPQQVYDIRSLLDGIYILELRSTDNVYFQKIEKSN